MKAGWKELLSKRPVQVVCRMILGGIFIYAAIDKIIHPLEFTRIIDRYKLVPDIFINGLAFFLPWIELLAGLFLILGIFIRGAAVILTGLLIIFLLALGINTLRGIGGGCGCFTASDLANPAIPKTMGGVLVFLRDLLFLIPGLIIIFGPRKKKSKYESDT